MINFRSIFGIKPKSTENLPVDEEEVDYDKYVDFYYTNLINSIILFSLSTEELDKLAGPAFDPIFELEAEIDYAFTPVCFETLFRTGVIDNSFKNELLNFKSETDHIPMEIWDWDFIDNHQTWISVRQKAKDLLDKLGITNRTYNDDYVTIYGKDGKIIKKGKSYTP